MKKIVFSWDYAPWPIFSSPDGDDPYPDIRSRISPELVSDLSQWAEDMGEAYADETGRTRPAPSTADELDQRFDELTARLIAEGVDIKQDTRWWRM